MVTILFDFWGTVVEHGVWSPIKQVRNILEIKLPFSEYVVRMERVMMSSKFKIKYDEHTIERLVGMWNKSWMLAEPYPEVRKVLSHLKRQGHILVLVASTDSFSVERVLEKFEMNSLFDHTFFSYQVGSIKSDPRFLEQVLTTLKISAQECVMVGDGIQSDIIPARAKNIKAILVDRKNSREYHPKIKTLEELEKVLSI
jgi:HAD superfamily hydrolase (TIGR01509 family)